MKRILYTQDGWFVAAHELRLPEPSNYLFRDEENAVAEKLSNHHRLVQGEWVIEDPLTLQGHKTTQWAEIKQARSQAEYAGFSWDGSVFDSDALSQQRITGAVTLAQMDASFAVNWTLKDNTVRPLNAAQMKEVGAALGAHVAAQFARAQGLRVQIEAAQTPEEVAALGW